MRVAASCRLAMGGYPFFCGLVGLPLPFSRSSFPFPRSLWASVLDSPTASGALRHPGGIGSVGRLDYREHSEQAQRVQNRLKRGKSKTFFGVRWCFLGVLRYSKRAKLNIFLNLGLERWANCGLSWLCSLVCICLCRGLFGSWSGLFWECLRASVLIVHQHTKIAAFGYPCAIAFPRCFNKSVLRAFLGGFFGFIG